MNIAILTSYPMDICIGSGVVQTIRQYHRAFQNLGHVCKIYSPTADTTLPDEITAFRVNFNHLLAEIDFREFDLIIGNDFDGYLLPDIYLNRYFAINGGILADIIRFETGAVAQALQIQSRLEKKNIHRAIKVIVPSHFASAQVQKHYGTPAEKVEVIYPGVDTQRWQPANSRKKDRDTIRILCVARQYPRKGIKNLITTFHKLNDTFQNLALDLVGAGAQYEENCRLISQLHLGNKIHTHGDIRDRDQLLSLFQQSDIFCLPSHHETFGLVFLEAMACGLPVIAYETTAVPEAVPGNCGILCSAGSVEELTDGLKKLIINPALRLKLGKNGIRHAREMSWEKSANSIIQAVHKEFNRTGSGFRTII